MVKFDFIFGRYICSSHITHVAVGIPFQAFHITTDDMKEAMRRYPELVDRLWRGCGVRIAVPLLLDVPNYYNWTKDKIRIMCENSFIATLPKGPNPVFRTNEQMKEVFITLGDSLVLHCASLLRRILLTRDRRAQCVISAHIDKMAAFFYTA